VTVRHYRLPTISHYRQGSSNRATERIERRRAWRKRPKMRLRPERELERRTGRRQSGPYRYMLVSTRSPLHLFILTTTLFSYLSLLPSTQSCRLGSAVGSPPLRATAFTSQSLYRVPLGSIHGKSINDIFRSVHPQRILGLLSEMMSPRLNGRGMASWWRLDSA
jgi:hypothetical protein